MSCCIYYVVKVHTELVHVVFTIANAIVLIPLVTSQTTHKHVTLKDSLYWNSL